MQEIGILFQTEMVRATVNDLKTETRRERGLKAINASPDKYEYMRKMVDCPDGSYKAPFNIIGEDGFVFVKCPYGKPGDILWVRETYTIFEPEHCEGMSERFCYKAAFHESNEEWRKECIADGYPYQWTPAIHMRKLHSRIWLRVKEIKIERVQEISPESILAEGIRYPVTKTDNPKMVAPVFKMGKENSAFSFMPKDWEQLPPDQLSTALLYAHWAEKWCEINGVDSWNKNPFVWVVKFEVLSKKGRPHELNS